LRITIVVITPTTNTFVIEKKHEITEDGDFIAKRKEGMHNTSVRTDLKLIFSFKPKNKMKIKDELKKTV
jgi:hypothetical protein